MGGGLPNFWFNDIMELIMINKIRLIILACAITLSVQAKQLTFGTEVNESLLVNISTLLAEPEKYMDKKVTVSGMIVGVCAKRGCWVDLASDAKFEKLRIKVRDGDMVFPMAAKGRDALAMGTLKSIELDLEQTKKYKSHLAKRNGETFDPTTVTQAMKLYQLTPDGVKILD